MVHGSSLFIFVIVRHFIIQTYHISVDGRICCSYVWVFWLVLLGLYLYLTCGTEMLIFLFSIYLGVGLLGHGAGMTANL